MGKLHFKKFHAHKNNTVYSMSLWNSMSELWYVTCHMGSSWVTRHPTQV